MEDSCGKCYGCRKKFKVAKVVFVNSGIHIIENAEGPVLMMGLTQTSLCGNPKCLHSAAVS